MDTMAPVQYWLPQDMYHTNYYEAPAPELASVPSLSNSPAASSLSHSPQVSPSFDPVQAAAPPLFAQPMPIFKDEHQQHQSQHQYQTQHQSQQQQHSTHNQHLNPYASYPALPLSPPDGSSVEGTPYCSPQVQRSELAYNAPMRTASTSDKTPATSGRRRAQNRAAQRAFRERKEKHARDLEAKLAVLTEKHRRLEGAHAELSGAYEKLRRTVELLTSDGEGGTRDPDTLGKAVSILVASAPTFSSTHADMMGVDTEGEEDGDGDFTADMDFDSAASTPRSIASNRRR